MDMFQVVVEKRFKELSAGRGSPSRTPGGFFGSRKTVLPAKTLVEGGEVGEEMNEKMDELLAMIEQKCVPYLENTETAIKEKVGGGVCRI